MVVLAIVAGTLIGIAMQPLGIACARSLLKLRSKSLDVSRRERVLVSIILALFGGCIGFFTQAVPTAVYLFAILFIAETAALIDYHHRIIPNELVIALIAVRVAFGVPALLGFEGFPAFDVLFAALGCVVCGVIFAVPALMGKKVGTGDIKFVAAMGFCLGLVLSLCAIVLMGVLVLAYTLYGRNVALAERMKQLVPMAPFLCVAMMVVLLVHVSPAAFV